MGEKLNRGDVIEIAWLAVHCHKWSIDKSPAPTITRGFLVHRSYEVMPVQPRASSGGRLMLKVRITTLNYCQPVVDFTVVPFRGEWLLEVVDLPAVRPTRNCN